VGDYYAILDLAVPGLLGNWATFQQLYKQFGDEWVSKRTMPFVLRRLKSAILTELPDKIEQTISLNLTDNQKTMYQGVVQKIQNALTDPNPSMASLTGILRLRQLCITPQLLASEDDSMSSENARNVSPKFDFVLKTLPELLDGQHSCLIYSQFSQVLDRLAVLLTEHHISFLRIDGTVPMKKRQSLVTEFQEATRPMVMLMTLKTGGVGLNLTRASYVIHLDPWWNPATEDQATDRAHRIGQTQTVTVLKLVMTDSIEERVFQLKTNKQALISNILKKGEGQLLNPLDLNTLISLLE
jgi:non-specific serine/threonine protein kinase